MIKRLILLTIACTFLFTGTVAALTPEQKKLFQGGILYYNIAEETCAAGPVGANNSNVFVLGDSLTEGMKSAGLETKLTESGYTVTGVSSRVGRPLTNEGLEQIQANKTAITQAGTVVIALGTNDAAGSADTFKNSVVKAVDDVRAINPNAKIYWVNLAGKQAGFDMPAFNAVLTQEAAAKNFTVIDWAGIADQYIPNNDVHPGLNNGYAAMSDFVVQQLGQASGGLPTTPLAEGANRGYNGEVIFNEAQMEAIKANQPFYESAGSKVGVPWQMIAVLHGLEHGFERSNPANGQGIYQLFSYTNGGSNANAFRPAGPVSDEEFQRQSDIAAQIFKDISGGNNQANQPLQALDSTPGAVSDTFFGYNGRAGVYRQQAASLGFDPQAEGYQGSPYVMNKVDAARDPATAAPGTWGQIKTDGGGLSYPANGHFGAWPMYSALAGISGGGAGVCGSSQFSGPLVAKLVQIAEQEFIAGGGVDMQANGTYLKYSDGVAEAWCADFVSWVFNEAGSPFTGGTSGGWRIPGVLNMKGWFEQNGEYHAAGPEYTPRVGDVVVYNENQNPYPQHVNMVVEVNTDARTFTTIGGNETNGIRKSIQPFDASYITGFGTKTK